MSEQSAPALLNQLPSDPVKVRKLSRKLAIASNLLDEVQRGLMRKPPSEIKALAPAVHGTPAIFRRGRSHEFDRIIGGHLMTAFFPGPSRRFPNPLNTLWIGHLRSNPP